MNKYTTAEAAAYLGVSIGWVTKMIKAGKLPATERKMVGRTFLIDFSELKKHKKGD